MKFNVDFSITYPVITDKAVVCIVKPENADEKIEELEAVYDYIYENAPYPMEFPEYFKGVAVYKEGDVNDIELAKNIARKKALRAAYKGYRTYGFSLLDKIYNYWDRSLDHVYDLTDMAIRMTDEIKALTTEES